MQSMNIADYCNDSQYIFDRVYHMDVTDRVLTSHINTLLSFYAEPSDNGYILNLDKLPRDEQWELLKQYMFWGKDDFNIDDWQRIVAFPRLFDAFWQECKDPIYSFIDRNDIERDFNNGMREDNGMTSYQDSQTGETLWRVK